MRGRNYTGSALLLRRGYSAQEEELLVWSHRNEMRHSIGQCEERSDRSDVPDVLGTEAVRAQIIVVGLGNGFRRARELHREVEHRALPRRDVRLAMVHGDLIGDQYVLGVNAQNRTVC